MSLDNVAATPAADGGPAVSEAPAVTTTPTPTPAPSAPPSAMTPREAASFLAKRRYEKAKEISAPPPAVEAPPIPAQPVNDAAPDVAPGESEVPETTDAADQLPPIDPPRSWTKEEKERFATFPRELQAYLTEREAGRERDFLKRQNEVVEQQKAAQQARQQYEQGRAQYELALPHLLQSLYTQQAGEFADIRTPEDVVNLARTDPARYTLWDAAQKQIVAVQQQMQQAQSRQMQERSQQWESYVKEQDKKFTELEPDFANPDKAPKLQAQVRSYLQKCGLTETEIKNLWSSSGVFRDARTQKIIWDAARYEAAKEAAKAATTKPLPPVQRPGTASTKSERADASIQALKAKFEQTGSDRDAAALLIARRRAAR